MSDPTSDPTDLAKIEPALAEALPGLEVLDRGLVVDEGLAADLVAVDGGGRLVLLLVLGGDGTPAEPSLACLDLIAWADRNAALLARHLGNGRLRPELPARVVLVSERFSPRLQRRLSVLRRDPVELLEVRSLRSAAGSRTCLVAAEHRGPEREPDRGAQLGPSPVPAPRRAATADRPAPGRTAPGAPALAAALCARMERVDDEIERDDLEDGVRWRFRGAVLARLGLEGGELWGRIGPDGERRPLADEAAAEELLECVIEHYARELGLPEGRDEATYVIPNEGSVLTPEEIRAFQE